LTWNDPKINIARAQRLGWLGHVEGMPETRMVKAMHCWKPISKMPTGRHDGRMMLKKIYRGAKLENPCLGWKKIEGIGLEGQDFALKVVEPHEEAM
jgi:hypothetical protein